MPRFRLDLPDPELIDTLEGVRDLIDDLLSDDSIVAAYDTETSGTMFDVRCYLFCIAYRSPTHGPRRLIVPTYKPAHFFFFEELKRWLTSEKHKKVAHLSAYDHRVMMRHGIDVVGLLGDTLKMHHDLDEERPHDLKSVARTCLRLPLLKFKDVFGKNPDYDTVVRVFDNPDKRMKALEYGTLDAWATLEAFEFLQPRLAKIPWYPPASLAAVGVTAPRLEETDKLDSTLWEQHQVLDLPMITEVLQPYHERGLPFDGQRLLSLMPVIEEDMRAITQELCEEYNVSLNLKSYPQLAKFFFETLKAPKLKRTATGWSTDKEVLERLDDMGFPAARQVLNFRDLQKMHGTYFKGMLKAICDDGRIHAEYRADTVTGRLRGYNPNLLNLPRADTDKYGIRACVIAPPGKVLICIDYDQLELLIITALSQDAAMLDAHHKRLDLHAITAADMYDLAYEDVIRAKKQKKTIPKEKWSEDLKHLINARNAAKRTGFGINYGIGPAGLARQISMDTGIEMNKSHGRDLIERYLEVRPGVARYREEQLDKVYATGFVTTILGRYRSPGGIYHGNYADRSSAERQAINAPIQGSAADLISLAMLAIERNQDLKRMGVEAVLQVHDELLFTAPKEYGEEAVPLLCGIMVNPPGWPGLSGINLSASGGCAHTWAEAKD